MKNNKKTITIGIPAFNEEANIGFLIEELLAQDYGQNTLYSIIVSSDGSDDKTVSIVRSFKDKRILVLDNKDRLGQSARQNQIIEMTKTDILILLNADITLDGKFCMNSLVDPIVKGNADLTSCDMQFVKPVTSVEKAIGASMKMKSYIFEHINEGNNIYTCHGAARAFSRDLYRIFRFKGSVGEDAYSYLFTVHNGFRYFFAKDSVCRIKLPDTIADHKKQSIRFIQTLNRFDAEFGEEFVSKAFGGNSLFFGLRFVDLVKGAIYGFIQSPIYLTFYLFIALFVKFESLFSFKKVSNTWEIAKSSKNVRPV